MAIEGRGQKGGVAIEGEGQGVGGGWNCFVSAVVNGMTHVYVCVCLCVCVFVCLHVQVTNFPRRWIARTEPVCMQLPAEGESVMHTASHPASQPPNHNFTNKIMSW